MLAAVRMPAARAKSLGSNSRPCSLLFAVALPLAALLPACDKLFTPPSRGMTSAAPAAPPAPAAAPSSEAQTKTARFDPAETRRFRVLPARWETDDNPLTDAKVNLGRALFHDARLSKNHDLSCNSCHDLQNYGADTKPFSTGHRGQLGGRNAPTVYNTGGHIALFWDGRAKTLEEQAGGPILNPVEMAMPSEERVVETLRSIPGYVAMFKEAFPGDREPVTFEHMSKAIAAFERQLATPSRFDRYLAGDENALTDDELAGFRQFLRFGCMACHDRAAVGGNRFATLGTVNPYPDLTDNGRYDATKNEEDRHRFRVPSLRNVAKTAPYFHNGSLATLDQVVRKMAYHQLGLELKDEEARLIIAFLKSLTGEIPRDYIQKPALPQSGPTTPKPDPE